jgi:sporulation protein YlmC with PRC-barrel domain
MSEHGDRLARLGELSGYKVADGDPDPRGWEVVAADGQRVGHVEDLIVDREAERAQYLDVRLERGGDRHVLIPAEAVSVGDGEQQRRQVAIGVSHDYLAGVTPYRGLPLTTEQEAEYRSCPPASPSLDRRDTRIQRGDTHHG